MEIDQGVDVDNPTQRVLENIPLNKLLSKPGGKIDLLLGMPVFWKIVRGIFACVSDSLVLLDTIYGNVLCGSTSDVGETVMARATTVEELNKWVEKLWQLDSFPRDDSESKLTMEEIVAVESMEKNLKFNEETGLFQTRLLLRGKPDLVNNHAAAKARLDGLMRRLWKDPNVKAAYKSVIQEFIDQSTVEIVTSETLAQMMISSRVDSELLKRIPEVELAPATENTEDSLLESNETSFLGIRWDPRKDLFIFKRNSTIGKFNDDTKTEVVSLLARPFDPLGLISPFILLARKILQQTFEENLGGNMN